MGRQTKNYRQTKRSGSAQTSAKNFARINREESWHRKFFSYFKVRGKYGKS